MRKAYIPRIVRPPVRTRFVRPLADFLQSEANSGLALMVAAVAALVWANSRWADSYHAFWHTPLAISFGSARGEMSLLHFVNDGLMALFFLLVGLEIKREVLLGELSTMRKAALPVLAALGGMAVPAGIYAAFNAGSEAARGWGIPMATDIAFALGVLTLLGKRVPYALKVFLAAVAIADDLGAVLVIALFYTRDLDLAALATAGGFLAGLLILNRLVIRTPLLYMLLGVGLWAAVYRSGIHATVAGVLLALTIPARVHMGPEGFSERARAAIDEFDREGEEQDPMLITEGRQAAVQDLEQACERVQMPLERVENELGPWVRYGIMPVFALANAGVSLGSGAGQALGSPVGLGIVLGLFLGKPIGISLFSWLAVRSRIAQLPEGVSWRHVLGMGVLSGIGFTMSLFIAELAFGEGATLDAAKVAVLSASLVSGTVGWLYLRTARTPRRVSLRKRASAHPGGDGAA